MVKSREWWLTVVLSSDKQPIHTTCCWLLFYIVSKFCSSNKIDLPFTFFVFMLLHFSFHASAFFLFMLLHFSFHASAFLFSCFCIFSFHATTFLFSCFCISLSYICETSVKMLNLNNNLLSQKKLILTACKNPKP